MRRGIATALLLFCAPCFSVEPVKIVWDGVAPKINVSVGIERVIRFENTKIQVGVPIDHMGIASAESNNGVVYLRCSAPFAETRYRFREKDTGKIFNIDVSCVSGNTSLAPISIVSPKSDVLIGGETRHDPNPKMTDGNSQMIEEPFVEPVPEPVQYGVTTLVRYAMQRTYSPERLVDHKDDIQNISFDSDATSLNIVPGVEVRARILGQWKNEGLYITALYLQNLTGEIIDLDPRYLTGRHTWKASALMNNQLSPANTFGDATTLVTVSKNKWTEDAKWLR